MDYYTTMATVLPLLYIAIVLEGRLIPFPRISDAPEATEDPSSARMLDISIQWEHLISRLLVIVGLPLTVVGLLVGIERGQRIAEVDAAVEVVGIAATLFLVCPPIWAQIAPHVPPRHRLMVSVYLFNAVVLAYVGLVVLDLAGWFGSGG